MTLQASYRMLKISVPDQDIKIKAARYYQFMMNCNSNTLYAFKMTIQLFAQVQTMLSHFVKSNPTVVCTCDQYFQSLHSIDAADVRLCLNDLANRKIFILFIGRILSDFLLLLFMCFFVLLIQNRQYSAQRKLVYVSIRTSSNQPKVRGVLSEKNQEVDVIRYAESSHKSVVQVLIKAEVLIVRSQTIHSILLNKDDIIDEWPTASQMIYPFKVLIFKYLHIFLAIGEQAQMSRAKQFKNFFSLQLQLIEPCGWHKLKLLFISLILLSVDQIVCEIFKTYLLMTM